MKTCLLLLFLTVAAAFSAAPTYEDYWYVYADGDQIQLQLGNASPLVTDWDNDGDKDLIVGRYVGGNIMYFANEGTNDSPILTYTGLMEAGGITLAVPYG